MSLLTALALASAPGTLQEHDAPARRELSCQVFATCDPSFEDRWNLLLAGNFRVVPAAEVFRGQTVLLPVLFGGAEVSLETPADVRYDLAITRPDGQVHASFPDQVGSSDQRSPPGGILLARDWLALSLEAGDPAGEYVVRVDVHDRRADVHAEAEARFTLVDYAPGAGFDGLDAVWKWASGTFDRPEPERVLPALEAFCEAGGIAAEGRSGVIEGYLLERLERDPWLLEHWLADRAAQDVVRHETTLWFLAHAAFDDAPLLARLPDADRERRAALASGRHDPLVDRLESRRDQNELWGRYLASRRMDPLLRLVLTLASDGGVVADTTVPDEESGADVPLQRVFALTTPKLLESILAWDPIAHGYAETLLRMGKLPAGVQAALTALLEE